MPGTVLGAADRGINEVESLKDDSPSANSCLSSCKCLLTAHVYRHFHFVQKKEQRSSSPILIFLLLVFVPF